MILPTKHLPSERALLTIGGTLLQRLTRPHTVSSLWEAVSGPKNSDIRLSYDAFVMSLDLLFVMGAIDMHDGLLKRKTT
jgi:hypothetical protein